MNNLMKYIASITLIFAGISILVLFNQKSGQSDHFISDSHATTGIINVSVDLQPFDERISLLSEDSDARKILPIMVLKPTACPPCINNVVEYSGLLRDDDRFLDLTLLFVDEHPDHVKRFLLTGDIHIPFEISDSENVDNFFSDLRQNLIFIDIEKQTAFSNLHIPNITTSFSYKQDQLNDVSMIWKNFFADKRNSVAF
ncbi:MAG: hypothetical protein EA359_10315 [Balneolaceae bacterium]|nr:MAG: hypothetical protein EA359_10315 [Balneolaceae bacterium]